MKHQIPIISNSGKKKKKLYYISIKFGIQYIFFTSVIYNITMKTPTPMFIKH